MKRLPLLLFLLLAPLSFAGWETIGGVAIAASAALLATVYAIGMGFGVNELQMMAKEELYQLVALGIMMAVLVGANGLINTLSSTPALSPGSDNLQNASVLLLDGIRDNVSSILTSVGKYDLAVTKESSKAGQCSVMGMGYGVSGCGGYSMLPAPLSMAGGIAGFAMGEVSAMKRLILISQSFALPFLLPLGILLRTFRITRGAGGFLIALGISMHIMLPAGIVFNEMLVATFMADATASSGYAASPTSVTIKECSATETKPGQGSFKCGEVGDDTNDEKAVKAYCDLRISVRSYLKTMLLQATLGPVIALLMMMASLRALTSLAGAEVDVSAISRFV